MERLGGSKYVIQLFSVVEDDENFVMVEELATGNDVMTRIEELLKTNSHFSEKVASRIFKEMLLGVKQCHDKVRMSGASVMRPLVWQHGLRTKACLVDSPRCSTLFVSVPTSAQLVVHRDLKPENFLFADNTPDATVKLCDFGLSAILKSPAELLDEKCGSAFYIAPEIHLMSGYSKPVGAFSSGNYLLSGGREEGACQPLSNRAAARSATNACA